MKLNLVNTTAEVFYDSNSSRRSDPSEDNEKHGITRSGSLPSTACISDCLPLIVR